MEKIVYVALDDRPCNMDFPIEIFEHTDYQIVSPTKEMMPYEKTPCDYETLKQFLLKETQDAYGLILSVDTLIYGGLVPSRIHHLSPEQIQERMDLIKLLKQNNPNMLIYGFQTIMRCPRYNGDQEEPPYYKTEGEKIHLNGYYKHRESLGLLTETDRINMQELNIPLEALQDFEARREINLSFDIQSVDLAKENVFDFLVLCQDDASEFGYPTIDQGKVIAKIKENNVRMKVFAYSGADELGVILMSRMVNHLLQKAPTFYIKYPSLTSGKVVPCLEDRYLDNTIRYQIISAGGIVVDSIQEADIILVALIGPEKMFPRVNETHRDIDFGTNLPDTFTFINYYINQKPVVIADLYFLNAGSLNVLSYIKENQLLTRLASYSGWNTSSNALGTAIAQGIQFHHYGNQVIHQTFLMKRYIEDIGYCNLVRRKVTSEIEQLGMGYFDAREMRGHAAKLVEKGLTDFIEEYLPEVKHQFTLSNVHLPWKRMFEVGFDVTWKGNL